MKKFMGKRLISIFMVAVMVFSVAYSPLFTIRVEAATGIDASTYNTRVSDFINDYRFKDGGTYEANRSPYSGQYSSIGCCAYAADFCWNVYGTSSWNTGYFTWFNDPSQIRSGDIIHFPNDSGGHWFVVLYRDGNVLKTAEGNVDGGKIKVWSSSYEIRNGNELWKIYAVGGPRRIYPDNAYHYNFNGEAPGTAGYLNLGNNFNASILRTDHWVTLSSDSAVLADTGAHAKGGWIFERQSNGAYVITSMYDGKVLDVYGAEKSDGTLVWTYPRWADSSGSNAAQEWYIYPNNGAYRLVPRLVPDKCLTCCGDSYALGTKMNLQAWTSSEAQKFSIYAYSTEVFPTGIKTSAKTIKVGESAKLGYTISPTNTSAQYGGVTYSSSNKNVVTVTSNGTIKGINPGTAYITVTLKFNELKSAKAKITVTKAACTHTWSSAKITKATFTTTGVKKYTCTKCGATKTSSIPALKAPTLSATAYTFDNKVKKPKVTVKNTSGKDVSKSVSYASGRKNVGKYAVKVNVNTSEYKGTKTLNFKINPAGKSISKITASKKAFTVKWSKPSSTYRKQMTGYQIRYSTSSKMKGAKTVTVKSTTAKSKKISKLKAKQTYYVQLRTYKKVGSTNYYSGWSSSKKIKTK